MSAAPAPDREHLVHLIANRHGIKVRKDDPLFAIGTMCEAYIEEAGRRFDELVRNRLAEFEAAAARIEKRTGQLVAQEFSDHLSAVRNSCKPISPWPARKRTRSSTGLNRRMDTR